MLTLLVVLKLVAKFLSLFGMIGSRMQGIMGLLSPILGSLRS